MMLLNIRHKNPVLQRILKKTFCGFSMGSNQYWAGRVYDLCVYFMTGTPEGSTKSGFIEKPGILRVKHFLRTQTCSLTFSMCIYLDEI